MYGPQLDTAERTGFIL